MGSSGSGGSSGKIKYPAYMEAFHGSMLDDDGTDTFANSVVDAINAAYGNSPFMSVVAFDPSTDITAMVSAITAFDTAVDALDNETDWSSAMTAAETAVDSLIDDTYINADINAFSDLLDDERDTKVLPRFKAGMRDINAVMTSAFVIGEGLIEAFGARDVTKYGTELRMKMNLQRTDGVIKSAEVMLTTLMSIIGYERDLAHYTVEVRRLSIAAGKEQDDRDLWIDEQDALWDLALFQYGNNALASIAGAAATTKDKQISQAQSAVGGAISGAVVGNMIAPGGPGAIIGGVLGLGASLL